MKYITTASLVISLMLPVAAQALTIGVQGNASTGIGTAGIANVSDSASTGASVSVDVTPIVITRADIGANTAVTAPTEVRSNSDLSAYASGMLKADTDANDAELSSSAVTLGYKEPAKLFGIIPMYVNVTATVNADGQTYLNYPWYTFFGVTDSDSLQASIETATATTVAADATASSGLSPAAQAQVLAEIHDAMKSNLQSSMAVNANVSVQ